VKSIEVAREALARAQARCGGTVRTLQDRDGLDDARDIFDSTWPMVGGGSNLPSNLFRALVHAGAYACVTYVDGLPVGATVALIARGVDSDGQPLVMLHSHMAAVREGYRNRSVGTAMKSHQRLWALEHGIGVVSWTFDPLVRRNLRLNMLKLGAQVRGYECNFYGRMDDDYDFTDESDRVFAWWVVDSDRANAAALGQLRALSAEELAARPDALVIEIPEDIVALRETAVAESQRWRLKVREQMQAALAQGYRVTNLTQDGYYVMERTAP
jgi:predicted GNAT superfamily acetyltransferase